MREVNVKLNKDDLLSIVFGLGIAEAWNDQKLDRGEVTCMSKSQYHPIIRKLDYYINNYEDLTKPKTTVFLLKINRFFRKTYGFFLKMNEKQKRYYPQDHVSI